ncbi:HAD family hydrolase [Halorarius halobius]|uniref:HAD family hydrolase n=1 Tax=Halorarius halobius TaxID=2962671 RepID=UPI0020CCC4A3|nr:HAD family hydrolase [Halorarius halobius]
MYDAVLFDVDDTLCRYRRSGGELLEAAFDDAGVDPFFDVEAYHRRYGEFMADTDGVAELRRACFATLAEERGRDPEVGRAVADAFAAERDHRAVDPLPGAREAVDRLAEDHAVGVVTNGDPGMQSQKLEGLGLADAFEVVVHAGYDAPAKPDPEPFRRALSTLDVTPERAVHVGNSLTSDVAGAHNAGLGAAWLDQGVDPDPQPHYVLDSMRDLHAPPWRG